MNRGRRSVEAEAGIALVTALLVLVIVSTIIAGIASLTFSTVTRTQDANSTAAAVPISGNAVQAYEYALEQKLTGEVDDYLLDLPAMNSLVALGAPTRAVFANAALPAAFTAAPNNLGTVTYTSPAYNYTMRESVVDTNGTLLRYSWWQILHVIPPNFNSIDTSNLVVYIRSWSSSTTGGSVTQAHITRAEFRPGRFSDFELLVDGPIPLGEGLTINGPVHSNGFSDGFLLSPPGPNSRIYTVPGTTPSDVTCGSMATFSTAEGTVDLGGAGPDCTTKPVSQNTGRRVTLLRARDAFTYMRTHCSARVRCFGARAVPYNATVDSMVRLGNGVVNVNGVNYPVNRSGYGFILRGRVGVEGHLTNGRVTIAADDATGVFGSGSIVIMGDTWQGPSWADPVTPTGDILGLMASGNVVVSMPECPRYVSAAILAASGAFTIPEEWRVPAPPGATETCPYALNLKASISSHLAPIARIQWTPTSFAGYPSRIYSFDPDFFLNPPPFFPLTGPWQMTDWRDANGDCLKSARLADSTCR